MLSAKPMLASRVPSVMPRAVVCPLVLAMALAACSSSSTNEQPDAAVDSGQTVDCTMDPRVDTFTANMTKKSASGALSVTLVSSDPAPPARGNDTWIVRAQDASGATIPASMLAVDAFMPDHGHGSSVKPTLMPQPDGSVQVTPLYLFMAGVWRVTFTAGNDQVQFFFCVQG